MASARGEREALIAGIEHVGLEGKKKGSPPMVGAKQPLQRAKAGPLSARQMVLDVTGDLLAEVCQIEKLILQGGSFRLFGKLSIPGRFFP